jgi:uncharacterized protein
MNKKQVLVIHGGDFFDTREEFFADLKKGELELEDLIPEEKKSWKAALSKDLGEDYQVFRPMMPLPTFARYEEWKVWFEKMHSFLRDGVILVGHSLGGIFLARYLGENKMPIKIKALFLIAPYFAARKSDPNQNSGWTIGSLDGIPAQVKNVFIYQSEDDMTVPIAHAHEYAARIPASKLVLFKDKGHFRLDRFPELVKAIRDLN